MSPYVNLSLWFYVDSLCHFCSFEFRSTAWIRMNPGSSGAVQALEFRQQRQGWQLYDLYNLYTMVSKDFLRKPMYTKSSWVDWKLLHWLRKALVLGFVSVTVDVVCGRVGENVAHREQSSKAPGRFKNRDFQVPESIRSEIFWWVDMWIPLFDREQGVLRRLYEDKEAKKSANLYCPFPCFWNCFLTHLLRTPLYSHICVAFLRKVQLLFLVLRRTNCRLDLQIMTKYDEITLKFVCLDVAILQVVHSCLGAYTRSNYVQER
jgi:hypothetical protein